MDFKEIYMKFWLSDISYIASNFIIPLWMEKKKVIETTCIGNPLQQHTPIATANDFEVQILQRNY